MSSPEGQEKPLPKLIDRDKQTTPIFIRPEDRRGPEDVTRS